MTEGNDNDVLIHWMRTWMAPACRPGLADDIIRASLSRITADPVVLIFPPAAFLPAQTRPWIAAGCAAACLLFGLFTGLQLDLSADLSPGDWNRFFTMDEDPSWL